MPDDATMTPDGQAGGEGGQAAPEGQAPVAPVVAPGAGANPPEEKPNYDAQALAELTANSQAAEALVLEGLRALDAQLQAGHPEIEDPTARKTQELNEREQRLNAAAQLQEFRAKSAMIIEAYKKTGIAVPTLINLAKGAPSVAEFEKQVASLSPVKPATTWSGVTAPATPVPAPAAVVPATPVDSGFNQGGTPKEEVWRKYDPADKILYAFQHSK